MAVGPDGTRALTASLDATLRLWDLGTRQTLSTLSGHDGAVTSAVFMGGGGRALSGGRDCTVRVWDLAEARLLRTLEGHGETVSAVDVSPGGAQAISASWDGTVRMWDLRQGAEAHVLEGHGAQVTAVRFATDGQALASAGWDGTVRIWEAVTGEPLTLLEGHEGNVTAVAFHPTGRTLASGGADGTVRLWDPRGRRAMRTLQGHEGEVSHVAFTPGGRFLVSSGRDHTVRVWDLRKGTEVRVLKHGAAVHSVGLGALGNVLLAAVGDGHVHAWHLDWEPDDTAGQGWEETARPFLETYLSRRLGGMAPTEQMTLTEADMDGLLEDLHRRGFGGLTRETIRPRLEKLATTKENAPSYWDTLRRNAPAAIRAVPKEAASAVQQIPWGRIFTMAIVAGAFVVGIQSWMTPEARLALSPYMAKAIRAEIDLMDLERFSSGCRPESHGAHLDRMLAGNPEIRDVACVAAGADGNTVNALLDRAPLEASDAAKAHRLVRTVASALAAVQPSGMDALCGRLSDPRPIVRRVVGIALAEGPAPGVVECVRTTITGGSSVARSAAILPFRQHLARGVLGVREGWDLIQGLLQHPDPAARIAGLNALSMYTSRVSEPVATPLLEDPDPAVAEAAEKALGTIANILRTDQIRGNIKAP